MRGFPCGAHLANVVHILRNRRPVRVLTLHHPQLWLSRGKKSNRWHNLIVVIIARGVAQSSVGWTVARAWASLPFLTT